MPTSNEQTSGGGDHQFLTTGSNARLSFGGVNLNMPRLKDGGSNALKLLAAVPFGPKNSNAENVYQYYGLQPDWQFPVGRVLPAPDLIQGVFDITQSGEEEIQARRMAAQKNKRRADRLPAYLPKFF